MFVLAALGAALLFAAGVVFQQRGAAEDGASVTLIQNPVWLAGIGCDVGGFVLQLLALHLGSVVGVQALLTASLPIGLLIGRQRPGREGWAGVALVTFGLAGVLLAANPRHGHDNGSLLAGIIGVAIAAGASLFAAMTIRSFRAVGQGLAAGLLFSLTAAAGDGFGNRLAAGGLGDAFSHVDPYVIAVSSGLGLILSQRAYAAGPLAPTLTALTLIDPLSSLGLGITVAGDRLRGGGFGVLAGVFAFVAAGGVVVIARARARDNQPDETAPRESTPVSRG